MQLGSDRRRHEPGAASAIAGHDCDVLLAVDGEGHREALDGGGEPRLPQDLAGFDVERPEPSIEISGERDATGRGDDGGHEGGPLFVGPHFLHRLDVEGSQFADVAVRARHLVETPTCSAAAAAPFFLLDALGVDFETALAERNDDLVGTGVVTGRGPVMTAFRARTPLNPFAELLFENVAAIGGPARLRIESLPDILEHRFLVPDVLSGLPVQLPEDAVLADGEHEVLIVVVDEQTLEHDVEIQ